MADDVRPLAPAERVRLGSYNGCGLGFKGFTRTDSRGGCFATRWIMVLGLPLIPLDRYYVTEQGSSTFNAGNYSRTTTRYLIHGRSRLSAEEIVRTYLFQWLLGPAIVVVPVILWLSHADEIVGETTDSVSGARLALLIGGFLIWLIGSIIGLAFLTTTYRRRWAPVRKARIVRRRPRSAAAAGVPPRPDGERRPTQSAERSRDPRRRH
jgi:hypothetical protein